MLCSAEYPWEEWDHAAAVLAIAIDVRTNWQPT